MKLAITLGQMLLVLVASLNNALHTWLHRRRRRGLRLRDRADAPVLIMELHSRRGFRYGVTLLRTRIIGSLLDAGGTVPIPLRNFGQLRHIPRAGEVTLVVAPVAQQDGDVGGRILQLAAFAARGQLVQSVSRRCWGVVVHYVQKISSTRRARIDEDGKI